MRAPQRQRQQPTAAPRDEVTFISSGSRLLDLVLGGGWAGGRVINIIGGESAGKTLLAVEACANFLPYVQSIDDIRYAET
jgi:RecA/RadA recombinase